MDLKDTTREKEPTEDSRATGRELASKLLKMFMVRKEEEKAVATREHALNATKSVTNGAHGRRDGV